MDRKRITLILTALISLMMASAVHAGQWEHDGTGWWYHYGNGNYPVNVWEWIDGNEDGLSECYYFDERGYMLTAGITPDGCQVNESGAWTVDGNVQTQRTGTEEKDAVSEDRMAGHDTFARYPESEIRVLDGNEIIDHGDYYEFTKCVIDSHLQVPDEICDEIQVGDEFTITLEGVDGEFYFATFRVERNPINNSSYMLRCLEDNMDLYPPDYYAWGKGISDGWGDFAVCPIYRGSLYFSKSGKVFSVVNSYNVDNEITVPPITFEEYITQDQGSDAINSTYRWGNHNGEVGLYGYPVFDSNTGLIIEFQEWFML